MSLEDLKKEEGEEAEAAAFVNRGFVRDDSGHSLNSEMVDLKEFCHENMAHIAMQVIINFETETLL